MLDWFQTLLQEMGETLRLPASFVAIEFIGTFAFAISGVRLSSAKHFDIFGAWIVGMATAIGGGTMRDLMLGVNPFWMTNYIYFLCCALAVVWVMAFGKYLIRQNNTWFLFDTIGLALFNVIGIEKTLNNEVPLIFRKEIYALACVAGGLVYMFCQQMGMSVEICALLSSFTVMVMRLLAVKFGWHLPVLKGEAIVLLLLFPFLGTQAQVQRIFDENVRTLQVMVLFMPFCFGDEAKKASIEKVDLTFEQAYELEAKCYNKLNKKNEATKCNLALAQFQYDSALHPLCPDSAQQTDKPLAERQLPRPDISRR